MTSPEYALAERFWSEPPYSPCRRAAAEYHAARKTTRGAA